MEKLIMLSPGRTTSINLSVQLEEVFGKYIKIEPYCLEDDLDFNIANSPESELKKEVINFVKKYKTIITDL